MTVPGDPNRGVFLSTLDWLARPGYAVRDLLSGNVEGSGRQLAQMGADALDAVLPGTWFPSDIARPQDYETGRDLVGANDDWLGHAIGWGVDTLTDPTTYIPASWVAKGVGLAGHAAGAGVSALDHLLPGTENALEKVGQGFRSAVGQPRRDMPELAEAIDRARGAGNTEAAAGLASAKKALSGLDERQLNAVSDALDNYRWQDGKLVGELVPTSADPIRGVQSGSLADRIAAHPEVRPDEVQRLTDAAEQVAAIGRSMRDRPGIFARAGGELGPMDAATGARAPITEPPGGLSDEYLMRSFEGVPPADPLAEMKGQTVGGGNAAPMRERALKTWRDVAGYLQANPGVTYERNALVRLAKRAGIQGEMAKRADIGQAVVDLARQGKATLPRDLILEEANRLAAAKPRAPVPESGTSADVSALLGGAKTEPVLPADQLIGEMSGRSMPPPTPAIEEASNDLYGIGRQSGTSKPPASALDEAEAAASLGAYSDPYSIGAVSGKASVPSTPAIEPSASDLYGIGVQSGKAVVPPSPAVEEADRALASYGLGEQSGKSVVGASEPQAPRSFSDLKPSEVEAATSSLLGKDYLASDPESKRLVMAALGEMAKESPETVKVAVDALNGLAPRGTFMRLLASGNRVWKSAATYGILVPRLGAIVRKRYNAFAQAFSNPEARSALPGLAKRFVSDLSGSISDALGASIGKDKLSSVLSEWDDALANSAGSGGQALATFAKTQPEAAAFIRAGGQDGYVRAEDLISEMSRTPRMQRIKSWLDLPGSIFRGVEDRLRLGMGTDLISQYTKAGMSLDDAARKAAEVVGTSLYHYGITSASNRTVRDVWPYAAWSLNAIPAEAKFLGTHPWAASALANAMSADPNAEPLPPSLEGRLNIDLGRDEAGNREVATGFGWPVESLEDLPPITSSPQALGRQVEENIVGQMSPLLRTAYGVVSGHEANWGTPWGSNDRIPVVGHAGELGRLYGEAAGTGLLSPVDTPARILDRLLDDRKSVPLRALNALSGADIQSIDPERAAIQQLQDQLARNPNAVAHERLTSSDPDTLELIRELQALQRKRKAG